MDHDELDLAEVPNSRMISNLGCPLNGLQANQEPTPNMSFTDFQYNQMSMDERVLLEIQSIGIFPEQPDLAHNEDEEIGEDIHRLEEKLHQQVAKKNTLLSTLEKSVTEARELQKREIEGCAYDKLVFMTFKRYMITVEKTVLEQANSRYELQGKYGLRGTRDRQPIGNEKIGFLKRAMVGHLGSMISSMGRWRMRLEVPRAEVSEMLPLTRLLSRSTDPAVFYRSKEFFIPNLQTVGLCAENLRDLLEVVRTDHTPFDEVVLEDISLPGLAELKGQWHGSLDASRGGNGDTMVRLCS